MPEIEAEKFFSLGYHHGVQGNYIRAATSFAKAKIHASDPNDKVRAQFDEATMLWNAGNLDAAIDTFDRLIQFLHNIPDEESIMADAEFRLACIYQDKGNATEFERRMEDLSKTCWASSKWNTKRIGINATLYYSIVYLAPAGRNTEAADLLINAGDLLTRLEIPDAAFKDDVLAIAVKSIHIIAKSTNNIELVRSMEALIDKLMPTLSSSRLVKDWPDR